MPMIRGGKRLTRRTALAAFVETLSARDLERMGIPKPPMNRGESMPFAGETQTVKDRHGNVHTTPKGIDRGRDYAPGKSVSADLARLKAMAQDKLKRLGSILLATSNPIEAVVSNAYEVAKAGGKHAPWYKQQLDLGYRQLEKGIQSIEKQIADHESWIADPQKKVKDWTDRDPRYQAGLLKKWQQDIARQKEQVEILKGVLKEKGHE